MALEKLHFYYVQMSYRAKISINQSISDLGYVGQCTFENETIGDFVSFGKKIYNFKGNYHYIIENFDLRNYIETPISFLSFGQKKKAFFCKVAHDEI